VQNRASRTINIAFWNWSPEPEVRGVASVRTVVRANSKRFKDRDVIVSRRSGGHIPGTCKGRDGTTPALGQAGQGNQSALHSRSHRKGTYASLCSQDRPGHAPNMLPKLLPSVSGLRVQAPSGAAQQASCSCGVVGPPLKKPSTILWNGHLRCPTSSLPRSLRLKASAMDVTVAISAERDQVFVCGVTQPASRAMLSDPSQAIQ